VTAEDHGPARALDRAVAENVLNMRVQERDFQLVMVDPHSGEVLDELPSFSLDAAIADQLAALLHMRGYEYTSEEFQRRGGWSVILVPPNGANHVEEFAETFPLAMCRAALRAVGVTPPEE
jgi:hypothetical protein